MTRWIPAIAAEYGWNRVVVNEVSPGFSQAAVWRVDCDHASFALKQYPTAWGDANRLAAVHERLAATPFSFMPPLVMTVHGATWLEFDGRLWDSVAWRPGSPLDSTSLSVLTEVSAALARFHRGLASGHQTNRVCPSIERRIAFLNENSDVIHNRRAAVDTQFTDLVIGMHRRLEHRLDVAREMLLRWRTTTVPVQAIHGDLWAGNVLIDDGHLSAVIDHASIREDSVTADLARLLGSLDLSPHDRLLFVAEYELHRPLLLSEHELLRVLEATGPVMQMLQWCKWLTEPGRVFADPTRIWQRVEGILNRVF